MDAPERQGHDCVRAPDLKGTPPSRPPLDACSHLTAGPPNVWEGVCGSGEEIPLSHDAPRRGHSALHHPQIEPQPRTPREICLSPCLQVVLAFSLKPYPFWLREREPRLETWPLRTLVPLEQVPPSVFRPSPLQVQQSQTPPQQAPPFFPRLGALRHRPS